MPRVEVEKAAQLAFRPRLMPEPDEGQGPLERGPFNLGKRSQRVVVAAQRIVAARKAGADPGKVRLKVQSGLQRP